VAGGALVATFVSRGSRGTCGTGLALVASWARLVVGGRRGTWQHMPSFCVARVALGDIQRRFAWQAWHL